MNQNEELKSKADDASGIQNVLADVLGDLDKKPYEDKSDTVIKEEASVTKESIKKEDLNVTKESKKQDLNISKQSSQVNDAHKKMMEMNEKMLKQAKQELAEKDDRIEELQLELSATEERLKQKSQQFVDDNESMKSGRDADL